MTRLLIVTVPDEPEIEATYFEYALLSKRVAGLNKGDYFMADDFDAPLSLVYWRTA